MAWLNFINQRSRHEKAVDKYKPVVERINALEPELQSLSDSELKARAQKYKGKDVEAIKKDKDQVFAIVREAAKRSLKMRHFDVQLMGGLALLDQAIAEMKTGEGKTLVATLPLSLHALTGKGAHLVTVNDYLSKRDAEWMRPVYEFLGLTVGVISPGQLPAEKREAYAADITYGTNNEFGFDYLRDNMAVQAENMVQRPLWYGIVDEVDSILIDEARTPLIISAPDMESTRMYQQFASLVPQLKENEDYNIDEKRRAATLTDEGVTKVEGLLGVDNIYAENGIRQVHHLEQALRAQTLYHRDKDYVVREGQVIIVDEFTGRLMEGRRYSEGLHQAIEAKEKVKVKQESRTLATITFQNFFRLYPYLAGMTGTAVTSAEEFEKVYNLDVLVAPTNKPLVRKDLPDRIYVNEQAKFMAVMNEIKQRNQKGQPVLVGTIAIEKSEYLSALLQREGIRHEVLNAKHHQREAEIIAQAGQKGAVTISTNMAGRGTDIKLGEGVVDLGGLLVIGTERHEARRIDNQLRGRSGRQGDPGETRFFVSLEDDVMRVFGGDRLKKIMQTLKLPPEEAIESRMVNRALEGAQERVEGYYFDMRKQVLSYDDVLNRQRNAIYTLRRGVMLEGKWKEANKEAEGLAEHIESLLDEQARQLVLIHTGEGGPDSWDIEEIAEAMHSLTGIDIAAARLDYEKILAEQKMGPEEAREALVDRAAEQLRQRLSARKEELGSATLEQLERAATIRSIDIHWMDHLDTMDYLRTGIGLRGYGQRDPLVEYQKESFQLFRNLLATIKSSIVEVVFKAEAVKQEAEHGVARHDETSVLSAAQSSPTPSAGGQLAAAAQAAGSQTLKNPYKGVGRNDPCPCGATKPDGTPKKFKQCHGRNT
ncbi:MAG: preprotein translocase subunit SecA [Candidatus Andersenbacteria bacterium]|nr:preprotein translocase subunit SecA [bacterium]MDZ4225641.1 preprotein translocase subunit SecA [Candidatus Andersenbacteria bacterium]